MSSDDGEGASRCLVKAVEEGASGVEEGVDALVQFAVGDLPTVVPPQHLHRVQPGAVGGKIGQDEAACGAAQHGLDFVIFVGAGVVPGDGDGAMRMPLQKDLQQLGGLTASLVAARDDERLARRPLDGAEAVAGRWLSGRWHHDLPALGCPERPQGRKPADVELVGVGESIALVQAATGNLERPFLRAYSGSGLVMLC